MLFRRTKQKNAPKGRTQKSNKGNQHSTAQLQKNVEKYTGLAKTALGDGDRCSAENYWQHADHYQRLFNELIKPADLAEKNTKTAAQQENSTPVEEAAQPTIIEQTSEKSHKDGGKAKKANGSEAEKAKEPRKRTRRTSKGKSSPAVKTSPPTLAPEPQLLAETAVITTEAKLQAQTDTA